MDTRIASTRVGGLFPSSLLCCILIGGSAFALAPATAGAAVTTAAIGPSSAAGGGYENTIALDPASSTTLAVGGDTSGVEISTDSGGTWAPANAGLATEKSETGLQELHVASLAYNSSGDLYAAVGNGRLGFSEVAEMAHGTSSWSIRATGFTVDGTNAGGGSTGWTDPTRPTGNLFGFPSSGVVDAGVEEGVEQYLSGSWSLHSITYLDTTSSPEAVIPTGMTLDPRSGSSEGFVTLENQLTGMSSSPQLGLWELSGLGTSTITACHVGKPTAVGTADPTFEVAATTEDTSGTTQYALYVAYGVDGLYRYNLPSSGSDDVCSANPGTWTLLLNPGGNLPRGASDCFTDGVDAVAGVGTSAGAFVWAGCQSSGAGNGPSNELWRIKVTYSGTTPSYAKAGINGSLGAVTIQDQYPAGTLTPTWWHIDPSPPTGSTSTQPDQLGGGTYVPSQLVVSSDASTVWISGRSGVWRTQNATVTVGPTMVFSPVVDGLASTVDTAVVGEPPGSPNADAAVADHDWRLLLSANNFETTNPPSNDGEPLNQQPDTISNNFVYALAFLPLASGSGNAALVAAGDNGTVEYNTDPFSSTSSWVDLNAIAGAASSPPVYGITAGYDASGNVLIIAATAYSGGSGTQGIAVMDCGTDSITSCVGGMSGTTWSYPALDSSFVTPQNKALNFFWPSASSRGQYIYVYDAAAGLWGSKDHGTTWSKLDSTPALSTGLSNAQAAVSGYLAGSGNLMWISAGDKGVLKYASPNTSCWSSPPLSCGAARIRSGTFVDPGPLGTDASGNIYVAEDSFDTATGPQFYELNGSTLTSLSGSALAAYQASMLKPSSIALSNSTGSSVYAYASSEGQGVAVLGPFSP